ncbi:hypothetical protein Athai_56580 [Actinocatenispora thailandica]|uniref:Phytase-like domain-containing protein n=1 Tax=Actinocatenispora thailandica TaxID=227318 RepID=A0A7R7DUP8_9ACTN|nr:esterase-like activity of phytase family protein [Actinocatenispora thailandica]BCJ38155.1 hypothetical protein Athai_56580 [Actinocatenispora thailandica]
MRKTMAGVAAAVAVLGVGTSAWAGPAAGRTAYQVRAGHAVRVATHGQPVRYTQPAHGTVDIGADGRLRYHAAAGYTGTDSFTYTASDAVSLYRQQVPPLGTVGGVSISGEAYGSALAPAPRHRDEFYGLTDRGPNVDGPDDSKVEPLPDFAPSIGLFKLRGGKAVRLRTITLRAPDGTPYNGRVNTVADTGETITDLAGHPLAPSPYGYDPEGLVAAADGTFWVSDEYGPFVTHFDARGRQLERLSPYDGSLPAELRHRKPNKGMEGLTITPDGHTLVGVLQSPLQVPDLTEKVKNVALTRIVTYDLRTGVSHEYPYLLHDPDQNDTAVSEITALSATRFLVDERDGAVEPGANKKLYQVDLSGATDVGPHATVPGARYDPDLGLTVDGQSLEQLAGRHGTAETAAILTAHGITSVASTLRLDVGALTTSLGPNGQFFGHDKVEGVATTNGGRTLALSNDNDFGLDGLTNDTPPYALRVKSLPTGVQDTGEYLAIDMSKVDSSTWTVPTRTVTVQVRVHR